MKAADVAGAITALMCGEAYAQSSRIAERMGPFDGYESQSRSDVGRDSHASRCNSRNPAGPRAAGTVFWLRRNLGTLRCSTAKKFGYKNSQVTVLAPTGTIGFMMDCDTTGIEPDLALVKHKKLVGGGAD